MSSFYNPFIPTRGCVCDPLISHDQPFSKFFGEWIGVCLWTLPDMIGYVIGIFNLFVTAFIQGPQLILNFKRKDCSGVSRNMLLLWVSGDFCGFLGLLLTSQIHSTAFFQQILGLVIDFTLLVQWFVYNRNKKEEDDDDEEDGEEQNENNTQPKKMKKKGKNEPTGSFNEPLLSNDDIDSSIAYTDGSTEDNQQNGDGIKVLKNKKSKKVNKTTTTTNNNTSNNSSSSLPSRGHGINHNNNNNNHNAQRISMYLAVIIAIVSGISPTNGKRPSSSLSSLASSITTMKGIHPDISITEGPFEPSLDNNKDNNFTTPTLFSSTSTHFNPSDNQTLPPTPTSPLQQQGQPPLCETIIPEPSKTQQIIGYFFAIVCGLIYTPSLSFQVIHNYRLKDATGMSIYSIIINIVAYTLYFFAVLLPDKTKDWHHYGTKFWFGIFPYVGSFFISCCCLCIILFQKWLYFDDSITEDEDDEDEDGNENEEQNEGNDIPNISYQVPSDIPILTSQQGDSVNI